MSKARVIRGLQWAERCERPSSIPVGRPRGAKAVGIRYEKALGKALGPSWEHGQWFSFRDINGQGYCQTDFLLILPNLAIILECKYSWVKTAYEQIEFLYTPVVEHCKKNKKPKDDDAFTFANGEMFTFEQFVDRRLDKHGARIKAAAQKKVDAERKAREASANKAAQIRANGPVANAEALDL